MRFFLLLFYMAFSLRADDFAYQVYDDYFAGTDQHFTYGANIAWLDAPYKDQNSTKYSSFMLHSLSHIKDYDSLKNYTAGISLSQILYTPTDITKKEAQYNDIPYAGYLALSFYLFEWNQDELQEYRLDAGVVGSQTLSGPLQYNFHVFIKDPRLPQGWSTQLGTQYMLNALYRYGQKSWQTHKNGLHVEWFNQVGTQFGNYTTDIFASSAFRFGHNYNTAFSVHYPYLREEAALLQDHKQNGFGWAFTLGGSAEIVGYSYVLNEGESKGYDTTPNLLNNSIYSGIDFFYDKHLLSLFYQAQTPVAPAQRGVDFYGVIMYGYRF
jgi:hypothetical protein